MRLTFTVRRQQTSSRKKTRPSLSAMQDPCPHKPSEWPLWVNKDPGVCCKCAHIMCSVCTLASVYACARDLRRCATEEGSHKMMGDFKTELQLLRKPVHCMGSCLLPAAYASVMPLIPSARSLEVRFNLSVQTLWMDIWSTPATPSLRVCVWSALLVVNIVCLLMCCLQLIIIGWEVIRDWLGEAAPPKGVEKLERVPERRQKATYFHASPKNGHVGLWACRCNDTTPTHTSKAEDDWKRSIRTGKLIGRGKESSRKLLCANQRRCL